MAAKHFLWRFLQSPRPASSCKLWHWRNRTAHGCFSPINHKIPSQISEDFKANDAVAANAAASKIVKDFKDARDASKGDSIRLKGQADYHNKESNRLAGNGQATVQMGQSTGHFVEGITNAQAKQNKADGQEHNANAETERASKEVMTQYLNQIKNMVEGLLQAFRDIRDTQDQVKANIAKNA